MFSKLIIFASVVIATALAEPGFEHPSLSYGANLLGGFNPELYTTVKALSPLQYGSSYPLLYSAQLYANSLQKPGRQYASAPLQYASAFPVSYAAPAPLAYTNPYSHLTYGAVPSPLTYAGQSFYNPQYASYAAAPVHTPALAYGSGGSSGSSSIGSGSPSPSSSAFNYAAAAAAAANAQALGSSAYTSAASVQGALDAALGRSAAAAELLYGRGVPFAFTAQGAAGAAGQEAARQVAVQFPSGYNSASTMVETPAQARSDSQ